MERPALANVAQLGEHCPINQKAMGSIPGQGTCPGWDACWRQLIDVSHIDISLPLFIPPFTLSGINKR